jgi:hypothetical protein
MKANELRIGNLVYFEKPVHVQLGDIIDLKNKIVSLSTYGIHLIEADENTKVNPIPLTEELLLKFGFSKHNNTFYLERIIFDISYNDELENGISICIGEYCSRGSCFEHIKSVHQLQNLYFALTGEELTIKTIENEQH